MIHYTIKPHLYNPGRYFWVHRAKLTGSFKPTSPFSRQVSWDRYNEALIEMGAAL